MEHTNLLYLDDFTRTGCAARVIDVESDGARFCVILDQTVFYPQGGGQPYDTGVITGGSAQLSVQEVRLFDGIVKHFGTFVGEPFAVGQEVACAVDVARRQLNSRLHAAGHIIDIAVGMLKLDWEPGKAFHFPDGPYVEYHASLAHVDKEILKGELEKLCNDIVCENRAINSVVMGKEQLAGACAWVPDYIPENKPVRVVCYDQFCTLCGGTHTKNTGDIGGITIRKLRESNGVVRVSYTVSE